jgi:kynurenine formamidase
MSKDRIIDLTHPIHDGMMTYPSHWHPKVEISMQGRYGIEGRETRKLVLGSHTGTHIDASSHFIPGSRTIDELPLEHLVGPAHVVSFVPCEPLKEVEVKDLESHLSREKDIARVLFRYDWSEHWGQMSFYSDSPYLSRDACKWLIDRGVRLIGMDTPSPDNPTKLSASDEDSPNHKLLLANDVILVEYLSNMKKIQKDKVILIALPLRVVRGDGAPARVIVIESEGSL